VLGHSPDLEGTCVDREALVSQIRV
jgi:hypothetical protein